MTKKQITFAFPADAWEGIMLANSQDYQAKVTKFSEDGIPSEVDNPVTREEHAIESIIATIARPWKQMQLQAAIQATQKAAEAQVTAKEAEVRSATEVVIKDVEEVQPEPELEV